MSISRKSACLAASAALLAMSGLAHAATPPAGNSGPAVSANENVHCYGINACKGQGFNAIAAGECLSKGGVIADLN